MHTGLALAALHNLLLFALVAMLVAQSGLLRASMNGPLLLRLAKLDAGYGACAGLLLIDGLGRVLYGIKGAELYLHNPWFHAKLGAYVLVGLLSVLPTFNFVRWRKALRHDASFVPPPAQVTNARRIIRFELVLIGTIFALATAMARHVGF